MKEYEVLIPFAGYITSVVEADSEEEAKKKAFEDSEKLVFNDTECEHTQVEEWELLDKITSGNVLHAPLNEIEITES